MIQHKVVEIRRDMNEDGDDLNRRLEFEQRQLKEKRAVIKDVRFINNEDGLMTSAIIVYEIPELLTEEG